MTEFHPNAENYAKEYRREIILHDLETREDLVFEMKNMEAKGDMHSLLSVGVYLANLRIGRAAPTPNAGMFYKNALKIYSQGGVKGVHKMGLDDGSLSILRISSMAGFCVANALHQVPLDARDDVEGGDDRWVMLNGTRLMQPPPIYHEFLDNGDLRAYILTIFGQKQTLGSCLVLLQEENVRGFNYVGEWSYDTEETKSLIKNGEKVLSLMTQKEGVAHH